MLLKLQNLKLFRRRLSSLAILLLILIVLSGVAAAIRINDYQQQSASEAFNQTQTEKLALAASGMIDMLQDWQQRFNEMSAENAQDPIAFGWPDASTSCVISFIPAAPTSDACIPVSFGTINSLRQADMQGMADIAVMQPNTPQAHILLTKKLDAAGYLVLSLQMTELEDKLRERYLSIGTGSLALQQGAQNWLTLIEQGDGKAQHSSPVFTQALPGAYWRLAFWPAEGVAKTAAWPALLMLAIIVCALCWLVINRFSTLKPKKQAQIGARPRPVEYTENEVNIDNTPPPAVIRAAAPKVSKTESVDRVRPVDIKPVIFKAYDIRGIVGTQLSEPIMRVLGLAIGTEAQHQEQTRIIVGRDGRLSSESFSDALIEGILASGCDVTDIGAVPTPLVYFASQHMRTHCGVVVTGSHNPQGYNGLKIVINDKTLSGDAIQGIYHRIQHSRLYSGEGQLRQADIIASYIEKVKQTVPLSRPLKVGVDCGNGIAGKVVPQLLTALGCEVHELFCKVDGHFPNHHPNPAQPQNMQDISKLVREKHLDIGLAFDGDGDRLGVVDGEGEIIWPDRLLMLFASDILKRHKGSTIVYDVKSTGLLRQVITKAGGKAMMCASGHSLIRAEMLKHEAKLAGELSGHIFFADNWYGFDDALFAACRLLALIADDPQRRGATEIFAAQPQSVSTPEILIDLDTAECRRFMTQFTQNAQFDDGEVITIDGVRVNFSNGWGLVRASNTVPGLTLRFEAETEEDLEQIKQQFIQQMLQVKPNLSLNF